MTIILIYPTMLELAPSDIAIIINPFYIPFLCGLAPLHLPYVYLINFSFLKNESSFQAAMT